MAPKQTIYRSQWPEHPLVEMGLYEYLLPAKPSGSPLPHYDPALPAFIDGLDGRVITRAGLADGSLRLATGLQKLGLKKGDTVCIWGLNSLEWVRAAYGAMAAGLTVSPANAAYAPSELAHQINNSGASLLFVQPELVPVFEQARPLIKRAFPDSRVVLLAKERPVSPIRYRIIHDLIHPTRATPASFNGSHSHDTAWLCYSSGTTGLPKGVMTTHHNLVNQLQAVNVAFDMIEHGRDRVLGILPFSHIFGLTILLLLPLTIAVPVVVLPRFEETAFLSTVEKYKITFSCIVPPIIIVLLHSKNVDKYDLSSLNTLMSGAAPLSEEVITKFNKRLPHINLSQGYGLTETSPVSHLSGGQRKGWVGKLIPGYDARLVKEDGEDAEPGERGELWVRGPSVMKGYHDNVEATDKTFAQDPKGRWFMTGDVLVCDPADGWWAVVDRVKELIKYKGFQVPPAELEALLLTHPQVQDVGVIGVYDKDQATELPRAYVVAAPGVFSAAGEKAAFEKEVAAWVAERVAPHKRLRGGVDAIDVIPKSPSGKILRKDLRAKAQAERDAAADVKAKL